jgi:hypothetical protein
VRLGWLPLLCVVNLDRKSFPNAPRSPSASVEVMSTSAFSALAMLLIFAAVAALPLCGSMMAGLCLESFASLEAAVSLSVSAPAVSNRNRDAASCQPADAMMLEGAGPQTPPPTVRARFVTWAGGSR